MNSGHLFVLCATLLLFQAGFLLTTAAISWRNHFGAPPH